VSLPQAASSYSAVPTGFDNRGLLKSPWDQIEEEIKSLAQRGPDWDGAGAAAARISSVQGAIRFCRVARAKGEMDVPLCVSMTRGGTILLEWHVPEYRELEFVGAHQAELMIAGAQDVQHGIVTF